jgi:Zn-dependent protease with chaperone function
MRGFVLPKLIIVLLVTMVFARYFLTPGIVMNSWLHGFMLVVHKAGHMIMIPFGDFLTILGGTFWQIAIPVIFVVYFVLTRQFWSASLLLFLVAFSLLDASIYIADARARVLPLITNDPETHDWWNLLLKLDLLNYDQVLGRLFYLQGLSSFVLALCFGIVSSRKEVTLAKAVWQWVFKLARV